MRALAVDAGPTGEEQLPMSCKKTSSLENNRLKTWCGVAGIGLGLALLLANCASEPPAPPPIPPEAISVSPDLYMLPMGTDADGCPVFQPWSPTLAVVQALHWQTAAGDFTLDRSAAACPADAER